MATDPADTTSIQSHHYLRISLALIVLALFTAIGVYIVSSDGVWLPSISHYFYTPAHNIFVAALIGAALALAALAGRGVETVFLDIAAAFAPLIALVPTGINAATLTRIVGASAPALSDRCDANHNCIPDGYLASIDNGILTYLIVVVAVALVAIGLRARILTQTWASGQHARQFFAAFTGPVVALVAVAGIGLLAFVDPIDRGFPFNGPVGLSVHLTATILFFGMFAAVPVTNAIRWLVGRHRDEQPYKTRYVVVYMAVPVLMIADITLLVTIVHAESTRVIPSTGPQVLVCEAVALALFAIFWVAQTIQRWPDSDAPYIRETRPVRSGQTRS